MDKMIVGINYSGCGERIIALLEYVCTRTEKGLSITAEAYKRQYDEVYVVDFNPRCKEFIDEIVLKGCRV